MNIEEHTGAGIRLGRLRPRQEDNIVAWVIHTTGAGPWNRIYSPKFSGWRKRRPDIDTPFDAACWLFKQTVIGPHYVVCGETGRIAKVAPESVSAQHVGRARNHEQPTWHAKRWAVAPRQLLGGRLWAGGSCNRNTIGVEVTPPFAGPTSPWTEAAWQSLRQLVHTRPDLVSAGAVLTHSDANPGSRTTRSGHPWDPGPTQWDPWLAYPRLGMQFPEELRTPPG